MIFEMCPLTNFGRIQSFLLRTIARSVLSTLTLLKIPTGPQFFNSKHYVLVFSFPGLAICNQAELC